MPERPTTFDNSGAGPTVIAEGVGGILFEIFFFRLSYFYSSPTPAHPLSLGYGLDTD